MMNAAIIVLEWPGSNPCKAPSKIAVGMNSHALPWARRSEVTASGSSSEIFGELFEFAQRPLGSHPAFADGIGDAVLHMIVDQCPLHRADRALDGLKLLGEVETGSAIGQHLSDRRDMPRRLFETTPDFGIGCM